MTTLLRVALTGNAAAGKSTVARLLRLWNVPVIDADKIVHELQAPGTPLLAAITRRFGSAVLTATGALDRDRLRSLVLADPGARTDLEALVHPAVEERRLALEREARERGAPVVVHDIPLLFEALDPGAFDAVILVDAQDELRLARLRERGLSDRDARALMATQQPAATKRAWRGGPGDQRPYVIENDGDLAGLEQRLQEVWSAVTGA